MCSGKRSRHRNRFFRYAALFYQRKHSIQQPAMKKKLTFISVLALTIWGCSYDTEEDLYPPPSTCNTTNVTFSGTVNPLLTSYGCLGCHVGSAPQGNINLQGHTNVRNVANSGRLYGAISHAPGFQPMPHGMPKMAQCDINKIKAWIDAGAPNN